MSNFRATVDCLQKSSPFRWNSDGHRFAVAAAPFCMPRYRYNYPHQTESLRSSSGFPSSSKWKSIVILPSVSWADSKFVTLRVGNPRARSTATQQKMSWQKNIISEIKHLNWEEDESFSKWTVIPLSRRIARRIWNSPLVDFKNCENIKLLLPG